MIYCLMFNGLPLTDATRALLFDTAQLMFSEKTTYMEIKNKSCEGYIKTSWQTKGLGVAYGVAFSALLETNKGTTTVEYIVRQSDVKGCDLDWLNQEPLPPIHLN